MCTKQSVNTERSGRVDGWPLLASRYKLSKTERESKQHDKPFGCMFIVFLLLGYSASKRVPDDGGAQSKSERYICMETHIYSGPLSLILSDCVCMWCWECESVLFACLLNSYSVARRSHTPGQVLCSWQNSGICPLGCHCQRCRALLRGNAVMLCAMCSK